MNREAALFINTSIVLTTFSRSSANVLLCTQKLKKKCFCKQNKQCPHRKEVFFRHRFSLCEYLLDAYCMAKKSCPIIIVTSLRKWKRLLGDNIVIVDGNLEHATQL